MSLFTTEHTETQSTQREEIKAKEFRFFFFSSVLSVSLCTLWFISYCCTSSCFAQQNSPSPLEGWYRTGRYMPVHVDRGASRITADGAVPTELDGEDTPTKIAPLLMISNDAGKVRIDGATMPGNSQLHALSSHQQLVAVAGSGDRLAIKLFPGESIVTIHVDPLDPLPGPALAWQTLDALILDGPWPGSFDLHKLPALLAGGTEIAVRSPDRPDNLLPWESIDGGWVLRPPIDGPIGCDGNDEAYVPVAAWQPDLTGAMRMHVVLAAVLFSLASLACLLLPRKISLPSMGMATLGAVLVIGWWRSELPKVFCATGNLIVEHRPLRQTDHWQFFTSRQATAGECDCTGEIWPILTDAADAARLNLSLHWNHDAGRFTFDLPADQKLAFVTRALEPASAGNASESSSVESPMTALSRGLYMRGGDKQSIEAGTNWNTSDASPAWATVHLWSAP